MVRLYIDAVLALNGHQFKEQTPYFEIESVQVCFTIYQMQYENSNCELKWTRSISKLMFANVLSYICYPN